MLAEEHKVIRVSRLWRLKSPAHHTDLCAALNAADRAREADRERGLHCKDVEIVAWDEEVHVRYERDYDPMTDA